MKTVTAESLANAYAALYPDEGQADEDLRRIMGNWLERYNRSPDKAIATVNWFGKVTRAFFLSLKIKQPKRKVEMLVALTRPQKPLPTELWPAEAEATQEELAI